jgi:flavocytochrome c
MTITYALMEKFEEIAAKEPNRAKIILKSRVNELITNSSGEVVGCKYTNKAGQTFEEHGPVIIATGGYAADKEADSLLQKYRPDILTFPTTNGAHATGDGIKMAIKAGADLKDIDKVQVHPTGLVHPDEPNNPVKFLAAEALRGVGGIIIDNEGKRFVNELGTRDFVSGEMMRHNKAPYRLVLNGKASKEIEWHCKHYCGRKLMKRFTNVNEIAKDMGAKVDVLKATFEQHNVGEKSNNDAFGKIYFRNGPWKSDDVFHVAVITPVAHYCMGGVKVSADSEVESATGIIPGLFATGEVMGGTHGFNRLGGSSLLDCVVFGRVSGRTASRFLLSKLIKNVESGAIVSKNVDAAPVKAAEAPKAAAAPAPAAQGGDKIYTAEEVAKHNTESDCWVIVNGMVLDVTSFLDEHPGGKQAVLLFAGRDATEEFLMLHKLDVIDKYAPECVIGALKGAKVQNKL